MANDDPTRLISMTELVARDKAARQIDADNTLLYIEIRNAMEERAKAAMMLENMELALAEVRTSVAKLEDARQVDTETIASLIHARHAMQASIVALKATDRELEERLNKHARMLEEADKKTKSMIESIEGLIG